MQKDEVNFFDTSTGQRIVLSKLVPDNIKILDIATSLSKMCRFRGHCKGFYSVAEHSVRVANTTLRLIVEDKASRFASTDPEFAINKQDYNTTLLALLHDAHEAYTGDELRGLKTKALRDIEDQVQGVIIQTFNLQGAYSPFIKKADDILLATEGRDLMGRQDGWYLPENPLVEVIKPITWEAAQALFISKFDSLRKMV